MLNFNKPKMLSSYLVEIVNHLLSLYNTFPFLLCLPPPLDMLCLQGGVIFAIRLQYTIIYPAICMDKNSVTDNP